LFDKSAKVFARKNSIVNYYSKTKGLYFIIIIKQIKTFGITFRRSVKQPLYKYNYCIIFHWCDLYFYNQNFL